MAERRPLLAGILGTQLERPVGGPGDVLLVAHSLCPGRYGLRGNLQSTHSGRNIMGYLTGRQ